MRKHGPRGERDTLQSFVTLAEFMQQVHFRSIQPIGHKSESIVANAKHTPHRETKIANHPRAEDNVEGQIQASLPKNESYSAPCSGIRENSALGAIGILANSATSEAMVLRRTNYA
jgi:hypothetical protein